MGIAERKAREFERREREILDAAFNLFLEKGPEVVTNEMIAEAAEVGKGTIYKHFQSKSDIYAILLIEHIEGVHRYVEERLDFNAPILDQIRQFMRLHIDFFDEHENAHKLCCEFRRYILEANLSPAVATRYERMRLIKNQMLEELFQQTIDQGLTIDLPAADLTALASGLFLGALSEITDQCISDRQILYKVVEDSLIKSFLK